MILSFLRREIVDPLYSIKTGNRKPRYWKQLERTQYLSETDLRRKQWDRLISLLEFAYHNNQFYRRRFEESGLVPSDIGEPKDLMKLPILMKKEIRKSGSQMISKGFNIGNLLEFKTGGSTGEPLKVYMTQECSDIRNSCTKHFNRWTGWNVGEPVGALWGNPILPVDFKSRIKYWLLTPSIYLDTMCVNKNSIIKFSNEWRNIKPTLLFGHAHSIFLLAEHVYNLGITSIKPKAIISSSMMLLPHERKKIEEVFGVKIFDRYGCEEVSLIASECEKHEGMHLNIENLFIEFVEADGRYAEPGEPGKIIVTDLINKAMPFIRYQVEDIGVPSEKKCSCGRGLPLMESVVGRVADFLIKDDGSEVAGVSLIENTLTKIPGIEQMQIVQESLDLIILNVVQSSTSDMAIHKELVDYFRKVFGPRPRIEMNVVQGISPDASGKYRFSICNVSPEIRQKCQDPHF